MIIVKTANRTVVSNDFRPLERIMYYHAVVTRVIPVRRCIPWSFCTPLDKMSADNHNTVTLKCTYINAQWYIYIDAQ